MIKRILAQWRPTSATLPAPHPARPLAILGDVHGRLDLLEEMLRFLDTVPDLAGDHDRVLVGDMLDRGPDSRRVLELAQRLETERPDRFTALLGNHEAMLLDFLEGRERSERWLRHGGVDTLQSYGVRLDEPFDAAEGDINAARLALADRLGETRDWLQHRPNLFVSGNVVAVHAAFDRDAEIDDQDPARLIWGTPDFYKKPCSNDPWVVHGHVITRPPKATGTRVAIDSGAWLGGGLTAAVIIPGALPRLVTIDGLEPPRWS